MIVAPNYDPIPTTASSKRGIRFCFQLLLLLLLAMFLQISVMISNFAHSVGRLDLAFDTVRTEQLNRRAFGLGDIRKRPNRAYTEILPEEETKSVISRWYSILPMHDDLGR
jgi:hypothetical protein